METRTQDEAPQRRIRISPTRARRETRGQATVEFALVFPLVLIALLLAVQVAVVAYAQLAVTHIAREVARSVAVDPTVDIGHLTDRETILSSDDLRILVNFESAVSGEFETVLAIVSYDVKPTSMLFGAFFGDIEVQARVKMMVEP